MICERCQKSSKDRNKRRKLDKATYLEPHQRLALIILVRRDASRLSPYNRQLHMLNLQPNQQEIYPPHNNILQMILRLGILKLDMQTILNPDIHLDRTVRLRRHPVRIDPYVLLADHVRHPSGDCDADKVPEFDIDPIVGFVLFLDVFEVEREGLRVLQFAGGGEFLAQG